MQKNKNNPKTRYPFFAAINSRLIMIFSISFTLIFAATILFVYFYHKNSVATKAYSELNTIANLKKHQLREWMEERRDDARVLAQNPHVYRILRTNRQDRRTRDITYQYLGKIRDEYGVYQEVYITDAWGTTLISTDRDHIGLKTEKNFIIKTIQSRQMGYQKISRLSGRKATFRLVQPVFDPIKKKEPVIGAVVLVTDIEEIINPMLQDREGMGETGEVLLVNEKGISLIELRWKKNTALQYRITAKPAVLAASGNEGIIEANDYRGEPVIAAYRHFSFLEWGMVVKMDKSELFKPIQTLLNILIVILIGGILLFFLLTFYTSRWITVPIERLNDAARDISAGSFYLRADESALGELGQLAASFNIMSSRLAIEFENFKGIERVNRALTASIESEELLQNALDAIVKLFNCQSANYYAYDREKALLQYQAGYASSPLSMNDIPEGTGIIGEAVKRHEAAILTDIPSDTVFSIAADNGSFLPKYIIVLPLLHQEALFGVLVLSSLYDYSENMSETASMIAGQLSIALNNASTYNKVLTQTDQIKEINTELVITNEEIRTKSRELENQTLELAAQQEKVEEASRLKSEFLSNMSHELRTPLNSILAISQGLISDTESNLNHTTKNYLEIVERNGRNLLELINAILDLSKIEAGKTELELTRFSLNELIQSSLASVRPLAEQKELGIQVAIDRNCPDIYGDAGKLAQVLINIAGNAVKFTNTGSVTIEGSVKRDTVYISVSDTGIGIEQDEIPTIFDEFRQVDGSTTRTFEGTGLGLTIAERLMTMMNGYITVESTVGKGSTFTMIFPLKFPGSARKSHPLKPVQGSPVWRGSKLLLVEDNRDAIPQIVSILMEIGIDYKVAYTGEEALEKLKTFTPSAAILDLMMPGIDGFDVIDQLRKGERTRQIPVLVLTAKDLTREDKERLDRNNIRYLVQKGTQVRDELTQTIKMLIGIPPEENPSPGEKAGTAPVYEQIPGAVRKTPRILIIEDNEDNIISLKLILKEINPEFFETRNGTEGIDLAEQHNPDIILLDIQLPGSSGMEVLAQLKKNETTRHIPVIAVTAKAMKHDQEKIIEAGFDAYISKPIDKIKLLKTIREQVKNTREDDLL
ncbi:MAG: response regulator [bacterium]|nr:response regulator [bacterium]